MSVSPGVRAGRRPLLRQPWFDTLFLTELTERFGFFGLQSVLVVFAAQPVSAGGLGLPAATAAALAGTWISVAYLLGGPGGWLADRVLGIRRTVLLGGAVTAAGHFTLAVPSPVASGLGLVLVSVGAGLYRPNHQSLCMLLLGTDTRRRESGLSVFYMGVQLSALAAPLLVGFLGDRYDWHLAFLAGGVVMLLGLARFLRGTRTFGGAGEEVTRPLRPDERRRARVAAWWSAAALVVLAGAAAVSVYLVISLLGLVTIVAPLLAYRSLYRNKGLERADRRRMKSFLWVVAGWTAFFMMISQGGSVMLLFAQNSTDRQVLGFRVPAAWFESVSPLCMVVLAPAIAWLLRRSASGGRALPRKLTAALLLSGGSFLVMAGGAAAAGGGGRVSPLWLVAAYLLLSLAELIVIAVCTTAASAVLPRAYLSQMLGVVGLFAALGGGVGSQIVLLAKSVPAVYYYLCFGLAVCALGVLITVRGRALVRGLSRPGAAPPDAVASAGAAAQPGAAAPERSHP